MGEHLYTQEQDQVESTQNKETYVCRVLDHERNQHPDPLIGDMKNLYCIEEMLGIFCQSKN